MVWLDGTLDLDWLQDQLDSAQYVLVIIDSATNGLASENCEVTDTGFTRKLYKICKLISKSNSAGIITSHLRKPIDGKERFSVADTTLQASAPLQCHHGCLGLGTHTQHNSQIPVELSG